MLIMLVFLLIFVPVCWLYGRGLIRLAGKIAGLEGDEVNLTLTLLAGFVALTSVASMLSLFLSLDLWVLLILIIGAGLILFLEWKNGGLRTSLEKIMTFSLPWLVVFLLMLAGLSIIENATHRPINPDTGIYHAQAIRWMETYPTVPGLGNLHSRFAYNSAWLVLNAAFSLAFLGLQSFRFVPAVLFLVAAYEFSRGASAWLQGNPAPANILRTLLLPVSFYVLGSQTSSPGTDLPVVLILWVLAVNAIERAGEKQTNLRVEDLILVLSAVYLLTVKLSAAPILLLAAWVMLRFTRSWRDWFTIAGLSFLILVPWLARNVILSGYLIYPFPAIDLFIFDWKIPLDTARSEQQIILAWARNPGEDASLVLSMPVTEWLLAWFAELTRNQKVMVLAAGLSPLLILAEWAWFRFKVRQKFIVPAGVFEIYILILAGGLYWLFSAPDLRFGYGFVVLLFVFPMVLPLYVLDNRLGPLDGIFRFAVVAVLVLYQTFFLLRSVEWHSIEDRILLPINYPHHASEPCNLENAVVLCANEISYTQCWYNPFPCIPKPVEGVYLRGVDWRSGFRMNP
jgi:hypothetical protein